MSDQNPREALWLSMVGGVFTRNQLAKMLGISRARVEAIARREEDKHRLEDWVGWGAS